ncbi:MAG: hypothetical protein WCG27_10180 [Pseudomonadota bacterium]
MKKRADRFKWPDLFLENTIIDFAIFLPEEQKATSSESISIERTQRKKFNCERDLKEEE